MVTIYYHDIDICNISSPKPSGEAPGRNLAAFLKSFNNFLLHGQRKLSRFNFPRDGIDFALQILLLWFLYLSGLIVTQDKAALKPVKKY